MLRAVALPSVAAYSIQHTLVHIRGCLDKAKICYKYGEAREKPRRSEGVYSDKQSLCGEDVHERGMWVCGCG